MIKYHIPNSLSSVNFIDLCSKPIKSSIQLLLESIKFSI
jgi:hypothetical protein